MGEPADVHAWAATVAFAATGRPTFGGGTVEAQMYAILNGQADLKGVPAALLPLIRAALHREPAKRPTAALLAGRLGRLARVTPSEAGTAQKTAAPAARRQKGRTRSPSKGDEPARTGRAARAEAGQGKAVRRRRTGRPGRAARALPGGRGRHAPRWAAGGRPR